MNIIAIDPGKSGGLAVWDGSRAHIFNCPETQKEILELVFNIYERFGPNLKAYIEKVHSWGKHPSRCPKCKSIIMMPQGSKSIWTFAENYASWKMALLALEIPLEEISVSKWQRKLGTLPKDKQDRKREIKRRMQLAYPYLKITLKTADALAILSAVK